MKKIILTLVILFATLGISTAQSVRKNVVKVNLFSPIVRTFSGFYERALSDQSSFQVNFMYSGASVDETKFRGFGLTPEYRFYLSENKSAPAGFYVGPFVRYQNFNLSIDDNISNAEATLNTFGGGLLIGGQWLFSDRVALDMFIGPSYNAGDVKVTDGNVEQFSTGMFSGFGIRFGVALGIGF